VTDDPTEQSKKDVWKMFDRISPRYDLVNRLLSFGIDTRWRKKLLHYLPKNSDIRLLDLATGTADQLITIVKKAKQVRSALGIDLSEEMIRLGQRKIIDKPYTHQITLMKGDATNISLGDESVDCITMSFGIRNVENIEQCLKECLRVLTPRGRLLILEFSLPKNKMIKNCHLFYLRHVLPTIGGLISRQKKAYQYLNKTIETFPSGEDFCHLLKKSAFVRVKAHPMTFGVTTLYIGEKMPCRNDF
jgi:demethylmenaquinone methyltransferase/2-methoxy-6-polyprenyl-1,4-benzoquinol methylase